MGSIDRPWGHEEFILTTQTELGGKTAMLGMRHLMINVEEMTSYSYHEKQRDIIYVEKGVIQLRVEDSIEKLEQGDAKVIKPEEKHQLQNIGDKVAKILEISFPYKPEDIIRVKDPYEDEREEKESQGSPKKA